MQRIVSLAAAAGLSFLLGACVSPYTFKPDEPTAKLNLKYLSSSRNNYHSVYICTDDGAFKLLPGKDGYATIPAGKALVIYDRHSETRHAREVKCAPEISFLPAAGVSYVGHFNDDKDMCRMDLGKEDSWAAEGFVPEPSAIPGKCSFGEVFLINQ